MSNLTQTIRNSFIRILAFFSGFFKWFTNSIKRIYDFFARLFGFSPSYYFLESDDAQSIKRVEAKQIIENKQDTIDSTSFATTTNRRKKAKIDENFLKMAREAQNTSN